MDKGHHRAKFHHTLDKITLDIWRDSILFNYLLPVIDKGLTVFILILLLTSPIV